MQISPFLLACAAAGLGFAMGHYLWQTAEYAARLFRTRRIPLADILCPALINAARRLYLPEPARLAPHLTAGLLAVTWATLYLIAGSGLQTVALCGALALMMLLALIDARIGLLPDALTLPLLWAGLALAWLDAGLISLHHAVASAMGVWLALRLFGELYRLLRHREGLGRGDIKLMAAVAAWLGWQDIIWIMTFGSLLGLLLALVAYRNLRLCGTQPFGPPLLFATLLILLLRVTEQALLRLPASVYHSG